MEILDCTVAIDQLPIMIKKMLGAAYEGLGGW